MLKLNPDYVNAYNNRGVIYVGKGDFDLAIKDYTTAIELNPQLAPVYYNRGEVWLRLKKWKEAKVDLTAAKDMGVDIIACVS